MTPYSLSEEPSVLPHFGLVTPTHWERFDTANAKDVKVISEKLAGVFPTENAARIRQSVQDFEQSLTSAKITQYFTYVKPVDNGAVLSILLCSIGRIKSTFNSNVEDSSTQLLMLMDQGWEVSPSMLTMHKSLSGEFLRAERLIDEDSKWPWPKSREVRYVFVHPELPVYALLTATSPNVEVQEIFQLFDRVAATFFWLPTSPN